MWYKTMQWHALAVDSQGSHFQGGLVFSAGKKMLSNIGRTDAAFDQGCLQTAECRQVLEKLGFNVKSGTYPTVEVQRIYNHNMMALIQDKRWPAQNVREFLRCLIELELGLSFQEKE